MSHMTEGAALGTPHRFSYQGVTYSVSLITRARKTEYQRLLEERARKVVLDMAAAQEVKDPVWKRLWNECVHDISMGAYAWHGEVCQRALETFGGSVLLVHVLFSDDKGNRPSLEMCEEMYLEANAEINGIFAIVMDESFPNRMKSSANGKPPVTTQKEEKPPSEAEAIASTSTQSA